MITIVMIATIYRIITILYIYIHTCCPFVGYLFVGQTKPPFAAGTGGGPDQTAPGALGKEEHAWALLGCRDWLDVSPLLGDCFFERTHILYYLYYVILYYIILYYIYIDIILYYILYIIYYILYIILNIYIYYVLVINNRVYKIFAKVITIMIITLWQMDHNNDHDNYHDINCI